MERHLLADARGKRGIVVMFIKTHFPYVKAIAERITMDIGALSAHEIGAIAVMPNDPKRQPEDADNMKQFAKSTVFVPLCH